MLTRSARLLAFAACFVVVAGNAQAAPPSPDVSAVIETALNALDGGNRSGFVGAFTTDATILDEISPFRFSGENAAGTWYDRLQAVNRENAITSEHSSLGRMRSGSVEGAAAYAVVPVRIGYHQRGKAVVEDGTWTFALKKVGGVWKIAAAAFSIVSTH